MSPPVLLNLLNELGKSDNMRGLPRILSLFSKEFNKFNNTGTRILDAIYHMTLKLFFYRVVGVKKSICCSYTRRCHERYQNL